MRHAENVVSGLVLIERIQRILVVAQRAVERQRDLHGWRQARGEQPGALQFFETRQITINGGELPTTTTAAPATSAPTTMAAPPTTVAAPAPAAPIASQPTYTG